MFVTDGIREIKLFENYFFIVKCSEFMKVNEISSSVSYLAIICSYNHIYDIYILNMCIWKFGKGKVGLASRTESHGRKKNPLFNNKVKEARGLIVQVFASKKIITLREKHSQEEIFTVLRVFMCFIQLHKTYREISGIFFLKTAILSLDLVQLTWYLVCT